MLNTKPGGSFKLLDAETVTFLEETPSLRLDAYASQATRAHQVLPDTDFLIAASGGGQRAAAFTLGVLAGLQELGIDAEGKQFDALKEVDYFSTVSGGGWAAGAYIAAVLNHPKRAPSPYSLSESELAILQSRLQKIAISFRSKCLIDKLDREVTIMENRSVLFSDIFSNETAKVPYIFASATIESTHGPFVFSPEYVAKYRVEDFRFCGNDPLAVHRNFGAIPLSVGIGASSSVPGFRHVEARSSICDLPELKNSFQCRFELDQMRLFDGGVYDNLGYKTGLEVLSQSKAQRKVMLVIDANADSDIPFDTSGGKSNISVALGVAGKSSLSAGYETYRRVVVPVSNALGINTALVSFSSVAGYTQKAADYTQRTKRDPLIGLAELKAIAFSPADIPCYDDHGYMVRKNADKQTYRDCKDNNFYRTGLYAKTSHWMEPNLFKAVEQLGILAVRLHAVEIERAILGEPTLQ